MLFMKQNPFIITEKPIPEYFCDRKEETLQLKSLLNNGNNVVLLSQRRVGKTALIQYCFQDRKFKKDYLLFYVDILSTNNLQEFTYLLGREIVASIKTMGEKLVDKFIHTVKSLSVKLGYDHIAGVPTFNFQLGDITKPDYTLKEIFEYLNSAGKPCIVAIDEFQQVGKYPEKGIEALIRSYISQINNCRFIFSGSERHMLEQMFLSPSRPFYNSCSFIELHVIPKEIYVAFICRMFKEKEKYISKELAEQIYDMFNGLTFYVQRICNGVFNLTSDGGDATEDMIETSLNTALFSYDTLFRERLFKLTTRQKELLFAIAAEGKVEKPTSVEFIQSHSLSSSSSVQTAMKTLIKDEIIIRDGKFFYIPERFFALWLKRNYI